MSDRPKHTPGPWTVQLSHHQNEYSHFIEADAKPGHSIACLEKHSVRGQPASAEECANARLIAAAPELLEALRQCPFAVFELHPIGKQWFEQFAKPAIAKAEGN